MTFITVELELVYTLAHCQSCSYSCKVDNHMLEVNHINLLVPNDVKEYWVIECKYKVSG